MDIGNHLEDPKALTHNGTIVKNQISKLEKDFKTIKGILYITTSRLLYEGEIYKDTKLMSI